MAAHLPDSLSDWKLLLQELPGKLSANASLKQLIYKYGIQRLYAEYGDLCTVNFCETLTKLYGEMNAASSLPRAMSFLLFFAIVVNRRTDTTFTEEELERTTCSIATKLASQHSSQYMRFLLLPRDL